MKKAIKQFLMAAYCHGLAPAWFVAYLFRALSLKHE